MATARWNCLSEQDTARLLNEVLDSGITLIDTSSCYGLSEERIGRHLHTRRARLAGSEHPRGTGKQPAQRAGGKVRFLGMFGTVPHLPDQIAMGVFDEFQIPYSALQPDHEELINQAAAAGAGVIVRGGTARGTASEEKNFTVQRSAGPAPRLMTAGSRPASTNCSTMDADAQARERLGLAQR